MDNFYSHKTKWPGFTEMLYISKDQKVSFSVYWYDNDVNTMILHNLYVSPAARRHGRASSVIRDLQSACGNKTLRIFVTDSSLIPWYTKRGFTLCKSAPEIIRMEYCKCRA